MSRRKATPSSTKPFLTVREMVEASELEKERERLLAKELEAKKEKLLQIQKNLDKNINRLAKKKKTLKTKQKSVSRITVRRANEKEAPTGGMMVQYGVTTHAQVSESLDSCTAEDEIAAWLEASTV